MILPFVIFQSGIFNICADFTHQQLIFNITANASVKSGDVLWSGITDLGGDFIGSYAFYLLGSPFFWISLLFPPSWFPFIVAPLLILKYSFTGFFACLYIRRFTKTDEGAIFGAVLYAFSGFSTINLFFNHFHDVICFFPLLLYGLEVLVTEKRKGVFAAAVFICAITNYVFFTGEVVFTVVYYLIRFVGKDYFRDIKKNLALLGFIALEAVMGFCMAMFIVLPAAIFTLGVPSVSERLTGADAVIYKDNTIYLRLFRAILFPAENPSFCSSVKAADFASVNLWLPMCGSSLAAAYVFKKRGRLSLLICVCGLIMLIPAANSLFSGLSGIYYARWFYMPVLILALCSALTAESRMSVASSSHETATNIGSIPDCGGFVCENTALYRYIAAFGFLALGFTCALALFRSDSRPNGLIIDAGGYSARLIIALAGLITLYLIIKFCAGKKQYAAALIAAAALFSACSGAFHIYDSISAGQSVNYYEKIVGTGLNCTLTDDAGNFRVKTPYLNSNMAAGYPSADCWISTVDGHIFEFCAAIGKWRNVASMTYGDEAHYVLTSTKYDFTVQKDDSRSDSEVTEYNNGAETVYVYERADFIPMGFFYPYAIKRSDFETIPDAMRTRVMLKGVVLPDELIEERGYEPLSYQLVSDTGDKTYLSDIERLKAESKNNFERRHNGFVCTIDAKSDGFLFFSMPCAKGFDIYINGNKTEPINSIGLCAVRCAKGPNTVEFRYMTPGLLPGAAVSASAVIIYAIYLIIAFKSGKKRHLKSLK